ncbi:MAG: hypothetical protein ACKO3R_07425 [bacterium]
MSLETIIKKYGAENISFALLKRASTKEDDGNAEGRVEQRSLEFENILEHNLDSYFHPASLLKLFISLMASELSPQNNQLEVRKTEYEKNELSKAIHESISASDNDALAFLIDYLAAYPWDYNLINIENTLKFSPDKDGKNTEIKIQQECQEIFNKILNSRLKINKFFLEKGFSEKINLVNKCFSFDYYGKEKQIYEALGHNQINNRDLIKLLILIEKDFPLILNSMKRVLENNEDDENTEIGVPLHAHDIPSSIINTEDYQVQAFSGKVLAEEFKIKNIYSKAGWNSKVRHDAVLFSINEDNKTTKDDENAGIEVCEQYQYILTVLTKNLSHDEEILQEIAREVIFTLRQLHPKHSA